MPTAAAQLDPSYLIRPRVCTYSAYVAYPDVTLLEFRS